MGNKFKQVGKSFRKGLQAGVLASALVAGNTSCQQPAAHDPLQDYVPAPSGICHGEAFIHDDEHLYGANFIGSKENWVFNNVNEVYKDYYPDKLDANKEYTRHYYNAKSFMDGMMWGLRNKVVGKINPLYQTIAASIKQMQDNYGSDIAGDITNYYTALAPVFAAFEDNLTDSAYAPQRFRDCYYLLAYVAYNRSRGTYAHANSKSRTEIAQRNLSCQPMGVDIFNNEAQYNTTVQTAHHYMGEYLEQIATATQTDAAVLTEVVDFALYNESLYGLNDFAKICKVNVHNFKTERSLSFFTKYIDAAKTATQKLDATPTPEKEIGIDIGQ